MYTNIYTRYVCTYVRTLQTFGMHSRNVQPHKYPEGNTVLDLQSTDSMI